jgi:adenylate cyclase, class 2
VIEAELKARLHTPDAVRSRLEERGAGRDEVYRDTYYDTLTAELAMKDQELRVRTVEGAGEARSLLTFKGARVDVASGAKPEHETAITDPRAVHTMLAALGYVPVIAFEKHCRNHTFMERGRQFLATVVQIPEIEGSFIELETLVPESELADALDDIRSILMELGVDASDLTTELYTDAVAGRRAR